MSPRANSLYYNARVIYISNIKLASVHRAKLRYKEAMHLFVTCPEI